VCPGVTGYASGIATASSFSATIWLEVIRSQKARGWAPFTGVIVPWRGVQVKRCWRPRRIAPPAVLRHSAGRA
jgi:hypothetical protein